MTLKLFFTYLFILFFPFLSISQTIKKQPIPLVNYTENVNKPFSPREINMLKEVYKDDFDRYVMNDPNLARALKHLLRNRIVIKELPEYKKIEKYKNLPTISLNNEDRHLKKGAFFNTNLFNPLKYKIPFFSRKIQLFKIENTNYYITIKPQH